MNQNIRIISGQYRGKKLIFPDIEELRPTPNRVRETLFNWLMHLIYDARCLDAFAGSGALGFEAFSRGAGKIVLIEQDLQVYKNLEKIALSFNSTKIKVYHQDACVYLEKAQEPFDIIFLDPPFTQNYLPKCMSLLENTSILADGGLVYLESSQEITLNDTIWENVKSNKAGQVFYGLYKKLSD
jgi:16S rRNA (guanine966-N2)-methyltransferase